MMTLTSLQRCRQIFHFQETHERRNQIGRQLSTFANQKVRKYKSKRLHRFKTSLR